MGAGLESGGRCGTQGRFWGHFLPPSASGWLSHQAQLEGLEVQVLSGTMLWPKKPSSSAAAGRADDCTLGRGPLRGQEPQARCTWQSSKPPSVSCGGHWPHPGKGALLTRLPACLPGLLLSEVTGARPPPRRARAI